MAMSVVFTGMLVLSLLFGAATGQMQQVSQAALSGAKKGAELCLAMAGSICLWSVLSRLLEQSGAERVLTRVLRPILRRLFPEASRDPKTLGKLSENVTANLLGLGNAATPLGIAAVKRMQASSQSESASDEMCRLVVLNTASIQLMPTTVAALRATCGAGAPFDILLPVWLTSIASVTVGLWGAKLFCRIWPR